MVIVSPDPFQYLTSPIHVMFRTVRCFQYILSKLCNGNLIFTLILSSCLRLCKAVYFFVWNTACNLILSSRLRLYNAVSLFRSEILHAHLLYPSVLQNPHTPFLFIWPPWWYLGKLLKFLSQSSFCLKQNVSKLFARGSLLASTNNHESSHPCSSKHRVSGW